MCMKNSYQLCTLRKATMNVEATSLTRSFRYRVKDFSLLLVEASGVLDNFRCTRWHDFVESGGCCLIYRSEGVGCVGCSMLHRSNRKQAEPDNEFLHRKSPLSYYIYEAI